jgi:hypothetical protein
LVNQAIVEYVGAFRNFEGIGIVQRHCLSTQRISLLRYRTERRQGWIWFDRSWLCRTRIERTADPGNSWAACRVGRIAFLSRNCKNMVKSMQREANMAHAHILSVFVTTIDLPLEKTRCPKSRAVPVTLVMQAWGRTNSAAGTLVSSQAVGRESWDRHP